MSLLATRKEGFLSNIFISRGPSVSHTLILGSMNIFCCLTDTTRLQMASPRPHATLYLWELQMKSFALCVIMILVHLNPRYCTWFFSKAPEICFYLSEPLPSSCISASLRHREVLKWLEWKVWLHMKLIADVSNRKWKFHWWDNLHNSCCTFSLYIFGTVSLCALPCVSFISIIHLWSQTMIYFSWSFFTIHMGKSNSYWYAVLPSHMLLLHFVGNLACRTAMKLYLDQ